MTPMEIALQEARTAAERGEVPVGAVVTDKAGQVLARAGNEVEARHDPSAHAEMLVLREAARKLGQTRLGDCTLTVTLEPCPMCAQAALTRAKLCPDKAMIPVVAPWEGLHARTQGPGPHAGVRP